MGDKHLVHHSTMVRCVIKKRKTFSRLLLIKFESTHDLSLVRRTFSVVNNGEVNYWKKTLEGDTKRTLCKITMQDLSLSLKSRRICSIDSILKYNNDPSISKF
jgi:hypothetical protein